MSDARKSVLVTGCSPGGIGHSIAKEFHNHGLHVFATARSTSTISDLEALGITTLALEVDKPDSIKNAKAQIIELTRGKLDFLVNNAGRNYTVPALDVDFDEVRQTFEVNVFAVMRMCQEFAPLLIEAKGCIVQIGSLAGVMPYVFGSVYNASKAALHAYSNTLRVELAPFGVKVVTIVTGGVQSNIARTERELPEGSLYIPLNAEYQRRLKHSQEGAMPNEAYARSVVSKVLRKSPPKWVWEGNKSWLIWFVDSFLPKGVMDLVFWRMFHLWKLVEPSDAKKEL
ncbi:NADPH-dependent 1-acyl dihydroxyacetone phosphate reductase [Coniosporium apollinis]|uniref:NADPH-dependent 1-acyl dihydroxyacetone phosphate reductase n=2 Tax=Coniosporium TaxID=2810619 RepID=A0ABQ9NSN7_9PEZI|nr:NADPH-dependent 1-acyl dihydroxyacetone phosphate reductase [Cladosporium sp. JES 115]KAJ9664933.1 NADPH-dependent 1-acyl dihydroxyacetone phosphate reductase [Coniosporium apollinis]